MMEEAFDITSAANNNNDNVLSFDMDFSKDWNPTINKNTDPTVAAIVEKSSSPRAQVTVGEREISLPSTSFSSNGFSLRRRQPTGSESYLNSTPFMDKLYEDLKTWYPVSPIRARDQLYYNMIYTLFAVEETIVKTSSLALFSATESYLRNIACYIIPNNHLYYQIFIQNWDVGEILAQYNTGDDHGLLVIPKVIIDEIIEEVWVYLKDTGKIVIFSTD